MAAPRILVTFRQAGPQVGAVCNSSPPQMANAPIILATEKTVPGCSSVPEDMRQKLGYYYIQQYRNLIQSQGAIYGPAGSAFSGYEDFEP